MLGPCLAPLEGVSALFLGVSRPIVGSENENHANRFVIFGSTMDIDGGRRLVSGKKG